MSFQPGAVLNTQGFGARPENVEVPHLDTRAPATTDVIYPIGKRWIDTVAGNVYELAKLSTSAGVTTANWAFLGATSGDLNTLTTQDLTVVTPTSGNINLSGSGSLTTTGSGSTATVSLTGLTNHAVLVGAGTSTITKLAVGATGQTLMGSTGADPGWTGSPSFSGTVTAGTGVTATTGNIAASSGNVSASGTVTGGTGVTATTGNVSATAGAVNAGTSMTATLGDITATNGNLVMSTAGNKIIVPTGANASAGTSGVMSGTPGAVTVATTACSATAKVFYCRATTGGTPGEVSITAQDGTGFTLTSTGNETSTFNWWIINA